MTKLAEFMIIAGADNRPPVLEKSLYDSWKSRMELYIENRENERMILKSIQNGPLICPTVVEEDGNTRTKRYEELSVIEKLQPDYDLKASNIVLQGLPPDVYAIVNHPKVAKEIWDRVKLLILPLEWSKFVTDVKLARDLNTTNYDQLNSYLKHHEAHSNETRLMRERYQDPLVFVANYKQSPSQFNNYHSQYNTTQFPQQTNTMIPPVHSPQSYSPMYLPPHLSQPQISHSFIPPSQQYQSHMDHQTSSVPPIAYSSPQSSTKPMTKFPQMDLSLVVRVFNQGDDPIACLNKAMAFLIAIASSRGNNIGGQARVVKCYNCQDIGIPSGQAAQTTIPNTASFQTEDLDVYDSDCDDVSNAKAVLMDNLSNYGSDIILEVSHFEPYLTNMDNQSVHAMKGFEQTPIVDFIDNEITSDSNIIPYSQYLQETQQVAVQDTNFVISSQHAASLVIDDEKTLILEEVSRSKMLSKQNDPMSKEKKVNTTLINYVELNRLSKDFGKRLVPQQELSNEQAFWLQTSHPNTDQSASSPVKIEAPRKLPKTLKDIFDVFVKDLLKEVTEVQTVLTRWKLLLNSVL
uniref:Integrase, catalytic region, zinc finger, CCHC-type, peptidase aspartic, catalytic n=1 Tax=Tanacetum cinerariifolium TaxID=118510 RepID=A0A6L2P1Q5_TANCI|nr:hypothetical protein [Tanacetum cinerariifolium]